MQKADFSLIIPAKNEAKRIGATLECYGEFFSRQPFETEIIVVVNDSTDNTAEIVRQYQKRFPFLTLLEIKQASGKGGAVAQGFKHATGSYVGFVDADNPTPPAEIKELYQQLRFSKLDGVIGSRYLSSSNKTRKISLRRRLVSRVFNLTVRYLFHLNYRDTQCGVKIFTAVAAKDLTQRLLATHWTFDVNLLLLAKYLNYRLAEVPVSWREKSGSQLSLRKAFLPVITELTTLWLYDRRYQLEKLLRRFRGHKSLDKTTRNILIFSWRDIHHPQAGGSELYLHEVAKRLAFSNRVIIFTSQPPNLADREMVDGVKIIRKGNQFSVYFWAILYYFVFYRHDIDFILEVINGMPFFSPLISRKPKAAIIHHVFGKQWFKEAIWPVATLGYLVERFIMPKLYSRVPIITISPSSKSSLINLGFRGKQIYLAPPALPNTHLASKPLQDRKSPHPTLLYLGRLKRYKRVDWLLWAAKKLIKKYPELQVIIAGTGDQQAYLQQLTKKLGLEEQVTFTGYVSEKEKQRLMRTAWVHVLPSMREGFGITIVEAGQEGTPSVGFKIGGVQDAIRHQETGLLAQDYPDFVKQINKLLTDKDLRDQLGVNAAQWARQFSWESTANTLQQVVQAELRKNLFSKKVYPWNVQPVFGQTPMYLNC